MATLGTLSRWTIYGCGILQQSLDLGLRVSRDTSCRLRQSFGGVVIPLFVVAVRDYAAKAKAENKAKTPPRRKKKVGVKGPKPEFRIGIDTPFHEIPIICVKATYNNTLAVVTDHTGKAGAISSGGVEGFLNAKKGTSYTGQVVGESIAKKAKDLGIERVRLKLKGLGPGRQSSIKGMLSTGLQIVSIADITPVPFNGNKPKKQRRI